MSAEKARWQQPRPDSRSTQEELEKVRKAKPTEATDSAIRLADKVPGALAISVIGVGQATN